MGEMLSFIFATLFGPASEFRRLRQQPHPGAGFNAVLLMTAVFAGFNLVLWHNGHMPTVEGIVGGEEQYYLRQAVISFPVFIAAWLIYVMAARFLGSLLGGKGTSRAMMGALGLALAVPILFSFVLPDIIVYFQKGHGAIPAYMKYYGPICLAWLWLLGTLAVREVEVISTTKAAVVAGLALVLQAVPIGIFIR